MGLGGAGLAAPPSAHPGTAPWGHQAEFWGPTSVGKGVSGVSGCRGHVLQVGKLRHTMSPRQRRPPGCPSESHPCTPSLLEPSGFPPLHFPFILPVFPHQIPPANVLPVQPLLGRAHPGTGLCVHEPPPKTSTAPAEGGAHPGGVAPGPPQLPQPPNFPPWRGCEVWHGPVASHQERLRSGHPVPKPLSRCPVRVTVPAPGGRASLAMPAPPVTSATACRGAGGHTGLERAPGTAQGGREDAAPAHWPR